MAWFSYRHQGSEFVGIVEGETYVPLRGIRRIDRKTGTDALENAVPDESGRVRISETELLPASWVPSKVFCVGLNYNEHIAETKRELPTYPVLFPKYASNLIGADDQIEVPHESSQVDYEGELAVIIGRAGRRISRANAADHILGYTVANDVTMRDFQYKTHQWMQGKAWDRSTPIGPAIVPRGDVDIASLGLRTTVDGVTVQESDLSHLIFDIPTLIAAISVFTEILPGDIILTGTPGGVGFRREPQLFLTPGMQVSVEIDGIGRIDSTVVSESMDADKKTQR
jgi:acylpyruvate hydrolase